MKVSIKKLKILWFIDLVIALNFFVYNAISLQLGNTLIMLALSIVIYEIIYLLDLLEQKGVNEI